MFKFTILITLITLISDSFSACIDKNSLSNVDAIVHRRKNDRPEKLTDFNFNLLDESFLIDLTKANVSHLCEGMIKNFQRLETLSLINVNLSEVDPGAFQIVPRLKHLSLAVNHLTEIKKGVFNSILSLSTLYLSRNKIAIIEEGAFSNMPKLKAVHLDKNKIVDLSGNLFQRSPQIYLIDFSRNSLPKINDNSFDDIRPQHQKPINIILKNNMISDVDRQAFGMRNPVNLHLEGNQITRISNLFFGLPEKSRLYLNGNQITCVSDDVVFAVRDTNRVLDVSGNPLSCDCMEHIKEILDDESYVKEKLHYEPPCVPSYTL